MNSTMASVPHIAGNCVECKTPVSKAATSGFVICDSCFAKVATLEFNTIRKLKFEEADYIVDNIYLGSEKSAIRLDYLKENNIDRVLVAAKLCKAHFPDDIKYLILDDLDDDPNSDISKHFEESIRFISANKQTNVLVHCVSGISRSASIVLAYMIKHKSLPYSKAYRLVQNKRKQIYPNSGFKKQLKAFDKSCNKL